MTPPVGVGLLATVQDPPEGVGAAVDCAYTWPFVKTVVRFVHVPSRGTFSVLPVQLEPLSVS